MLVLALLAASVPLSAAAEEPYLPLNDEPTYCARYGISEYCSLIRFTDLQRAAANYEFIGDYVNELAYKDNLRYTGPLEITEITVSADITSDASISATYKLENPSDEEVTASFAMSNTPIGTKLYEGDSPINADPLSDGWSSTFSPGEKKEFSIEFNEQLYGDIFGYNVNLLIDSRIPDNQLTPAGKFDFTLPADAAIEQCAPSSYTTSTAGGRVKVTWQKADFIPWTNPFNDLVCKWNYTAAAPAQPPAEQPVQGRSIDMMLVAIILVIILIAAIVLYPRLRERLKK
jgi:hypothetical protein